MFLVDIVGFPNRLLPLNPRLILVPQVMCTTTMADDSVENCTWLSCFEWCLTKSSGLCMQIWVSVRQNGSDLSFDQVTDRVEKSCTTDDLIPTHRHICRKDQCENLLGELKS